MNWIQFWLMYQQNCSLSSNPESLWWSCISKAASLSRRSQKSWIPWLSATFLTSAAVAASVAGPRSGSGTSHLVKQHSQGWPSSIPRGSPETAGTAAIRGSLSSGWWAAQGAATDCRRAVPKGFGGAGGWRQSAPATRAGTSHRFPGPPRAAAT